MGMRIMRKQYLGDKKDAFKWDYLNFLVKKLEFSRLRILLMLTTDECEKHKESRPENFCGACETIYALCRKLKKSKTDGWRFLELIKELPGEGGGYTIDFCGKERVFFSCSERHRYFEVPKFGDGELVFADPNTGFEPPKSRSNCNHICYDDVGKLIELMPSSSLLCIFQDAKRGQSKGNFPGRFYAISKQLANLKGCTAAVYSTAVYWDVNTMFVVLSKSERMIREVRGFNKEYCDTRCQVSPPPQE